MSYKDVVLFYGHTNGSYYYFSNFYPSEFTFDGIKFNCSEQAYVYFKSSDKEFRRKLLRESDPFKIKKMGRNCKLDPKWDAKKYNIMCDILLAKFSQNEKLKQVLLSTGDLPIHEDCKDPWWGGGPNFPGGRDLLGKALINVRKKIKGT